MGISGSSSLSTLDGMSSLLEVNSLTIEGNDALTSLDGLSGIEIGALHVEGNPSLVDLPDLSPVDDPWKLVIVDNDSLTDLDGLSHIRSVWWLSIEDNDVLTSLAGLESLERVLGDHHGHPVTCLSSWTTTACARASWTTSRSGSPRRARRSPAATTRAADPRRSSEPRPVPKYDRPDSIDVFGVDRVFGTGRGADLCVYIRHNYTWEFAGQLPCHEGHYSDTVAIGTISDEGALEGLPEDMFKGALHVWSNVPVRINGADVPPMYIYRATVP